MEQSNFKFRLIAARYIFGLLGAFIGCFIFVFLLLLADQVFFIVPENLVDSLFYLILGIGIIGVSYCIFKTIQSIRKGKEKVVFTSTEMQSEVFGTIPYKEVQSYRIDLKFTWLNWDNPTPGLKIRLKDKRWIAYDLSSKKNEEGKKEAEEYFKFVLTFMDQMKAFDQKNEQTDSYFKALEKMKKARKYKNNPPVYLYGIGMLIFALLLYLISLNR